MYFIADYLGSMLFYPTSTKTLSLSMLSSLDASSFTQGQANYLLEQTIDYVQSNQSYLPVGVQMLARGDEALCYDFNYGQVILKAKHATSRMVAAADLKKNTGRSIHFEIK